MEIKSVLRLNFLKQREVQRDRDTMQKNISIRSSYILRKQNSELNCQACDATELHKDEKIEKKREEKMIFDSSWSQEITRNTQGAVLA